MEKTFAKAEELIDSVKEYINNRIDAVKLSAAEKASAITANVLAGIFVALILFLFIIFGGVALALVLGIWLGKMWLGFLLVAGFYLLLALIIWAARGRIIRLPVMNALIKQLFSSDEED
ncbi:MAG: phage holin family protein [Chitinophagaceae bacterium]|nr:phage holin family protein [Chitinophagaceae bacterium]